MSSNPDTFYDESLVYQENTIKVGDKITLHSYNSENRDVLVGGIIRKSIDDSLYCTGKPNQMFVSSQLVSNEINYVSLSFKDDIKTEPLESSFSSLCSKNNLSFTNNTSIKKQMMDMIEQDVIFYLIVIFIIFMVLVFTHIIFLTKRKKELAYEYMVFDQLGIDEKVIHKRIWMEAILKLFFILCFSLLIYVFIQYLQFQNDFSYMYPFSMRFSYEYWSWIYYFVFTGIFSFFYLILNVIVLKPSKL